MKFYSLLSLAMTLHFLHVGYTTIAVEISGLLDKQTYAQTYGGNGLVISNNVKLTDISGSSISRDQTSNRRRYQNYIFRDIHQRAHLVAALLCSKNSPGLKIIIMIIIIIIQNF